MKHLLFLITLTLIMAFGSHDTVSAANDTRNSDKLQKVEQRENRHDAILSDASDIYRICNSRPERLVPTWTHSASKVGNKLPFHHKIYQSLLIRFCGMPRSETAPFHFDVASKYYVICLRHLRC